MHVPTSRLPGFPDRSAALARGALVAASLAMSQAVGAQSEPTHFVRYAHGGRVAYGILEEGRVYELNGDLFATPVRTGRALPLERVRLLAPCIPSKVIAVGRNYRSHIGDQQPATYPGLFAKYPTSIIGPGDSIVMPADASNLHYEGELVVVIGREARHVSVEQAPRYIFGVTAGNDVSERDWQRDDLQWLRAKASDTFGPIGPVVTTGIDYHDLQLVTRVNGEERQSARTSQLIFDVATIVSYVSRYVTLMPGDLIFTGTPGTTAALKPGDVVEVELQGVGVLRNTVIRAADAESNGRE